MSRFWFLVFFLGSCVHDPKPKEDAVESSWLAEHPESLAKFKYALSALNTMRGGDLEESERLLKEAYEADPNAFLALKHLQVKKRLGTKYLDGKDLDTVRKLVLNHPKSRNLRAALIGFLLAANERDEAIEHLQALLVLDPKDEEAHIQLIHLYQGDSESKLAAAVKSFLKARPESGAAWYYSAGLSQRRKQHKEALAAAAKAYALSPTKEVVILYAYLQHKYGKKSQARKLFEEFFSKKVLSRRQLFDRLSLLGRVYGNKHGWKSLELDVKPGFNRDLIVVFYLMSHKKYEESSVLLEQLLKVGWQQDMLHYYLALVYEQLNKESEAVKHLSRVSAKSEYYHLARYYKAQLYYRSSKYAEAYEILKEYLVGQAEVGVYILTAQVLGGLQKNSEAIKILEQGLEIHKTDVHAWFLLGVFQEKEQQIKASIASMYKVLDLDKDFVQAANFIAYTYAERGEKLDEAEGLVRQALAVEPRNGYYLDTLAWVLFKKGNFKKAYVLLKQALVFAPDEGVIYEHLGDVSVVLGQRERANDYYTKAFENFSTDADKARVLAKFKGSV